MPSGAGSQAQGPNPTRPRMDDHCSLTGPRAEGPRKDEYREDPRSQKLSPSPGWSPNSMASRPCWTVLPGHEEAQAPSSLSSTPNTLSTDSRPAAGPLACLDRRKEARLPFSKFLDEVTVRVLDPGTLESFRGPRGHSPESSVGEWGPDSTQAPHTGTETPEKALSPSPWLTSGTAAEATGGPGSSTEPSEPPVDSDEHGDQATTSWGSPGRASAADMEKLRLRSPWVPSCLGQSHVLQGRLARSSPSIWDSALQEQKGELRKRLSYTTHKLEKLETEFDSTRHYLEIELRRAQEELEKVTEKLRRIQSNYLALQRINQELEDKLYRMGQHYEEEKRALSHEIVALNSHLLEAKVTIDKLSEDNELYRKDCNLAARLLQCSQTYGRVHKVSELPSDFQERVSLHLEKHGCSLPSPLCHPAYADSVPACVLAKVLEKPDPASLSSRLSDASARDLAFGDGPDKARAPYKGDAYCSDTALYCPDERRRERRPSADAPAEARFLRAQNSTDSAADEDEDEAARFPAGFRRAAFPGYAGSLPTSSSYSSFSATSEEKEHAQAGTLTASQQAVYLNSRDELFERKPFPSGGGGGGARFKAAGPLEAEVAPAFARTASPYPAAEPFRFPASPGPRQALLPPGLWSLQPKPASARLPGDEAHAQWRPLSVEDVGPYSYPSGRASPCSFSERYYGSAGSPGAKAEGRASPLYASYKGDSFSEGDDLSQGRLAEPCFLRAAGDLGLSPGRSADQLPGYAPSEGSGERLGVPLGGAGGSPESERGPGYGSEHSAHSSRASLEPSSMEASPEMRPAALLSTPQAFPRTGSSGLSRKDSLTKAQLYGTLLN